MQTFLTIALILVLLVILFQLLFRFFGKTITKAIYQKIKTTKHNYNVGEEKLEYEGATHLKGLITTNTYYLKESVTDVDLHSNESNEVDLKVTYREYAQGDAELSWKADTIEATSKLSKPVLITKIVVACLAISVWTYQSAWVASLYPLSRVARKSQLKLVWEISI